MKQMGFEISSERILAALGKPMLSVEQAISQLTEETLICTPRLTRQRPPQTETGVTIVAGRATSVKGRKRAKNTEANVVGRPESRGCESHRALWTRRDEAREACPEKPRAQMHATVRRKQNTAKGKASKSQVDKYSMESWLCELPSTEYNDLIARVTRRRSNTRRRPQVCRCRM